VTDLMDRAPIRGPSSPTLSEFQQRQRRLLLDRAVTLGVLLVAFAWAMWGTGFGIWTFITGFRASVEFVVVDMLPPRLEVAPQFIGPALDTLYMSYVGMVMSIVLSVPLAILAARNTTVNRGVAVLSKAMAAMIRAVPELVIGILLVAIFGIGPLAGTIAIGVGGVGILAKAYADGIEEIDMREVEGLTAAGAGRLQILGQGVWPQFKPTFVTWSLYRLDLNIREAAVLGLVGAGGLGFSLQQSINLFRFKSAATVILMIFVLILIVEFVTGQLRRRAL
jgi:phosphonate transport system permease protein